MTHENKHTPGEWLYGQCNSSKVSNIYYTIHAENGHLVCDTITRENDACLIAASPCLLEALEDLLDNGRDAMSIANARKAISRARGQQ